MNRVIMGLCVAAFLAPAASAAKSDASDPLEGFERTGEVTACLSARSADVTALDETRLLYRVGVNQYYLNEVRGRCNNADRNFTRLETARTLTSACSGDIVRVVSQTGGFLEGTCALGDFEKLVQKPKDAAQRDPE
jgi:hypothetical protein